MSVLAASQFPKPADEQAFERACVVLWRGLLGDPNIQRNGRRGQRQKGVDLYGYRNGDPRRLTGIQCKLKGHDKVLTEDEVRHEVAEALTFTPPLQEFFIVTTAPDDAALQTLARTLTLEQHEAGRTIAIYVWGWNTLEDRISEFPDAVAAFDPSFTSFGAKTVEAVESVRRGQVEAQAEARSQTERLSLQLQAQQIILTRIDDRTNPSALEAELDASIDTYRALIDEGKASTAKGLFEALLARVGSTASGRLIFRIKANIGACLIALGDDKAGAALLLDAYDHAPEEPRAVANRVLGLLLLDQAPEALDFGRSALKADPTNALLAGQVVQAARFDATVEDPLDLVPEPLRGASAVAIARVEFLRQRDRTEWRVAAREAAALWPDEDHARQFGAEAELDEILGDDAFQRTRLLTLEDRARVQAAADVLRGLWKRNRVLKPSGDEVTVGQAVNLLVALHGLDQLPDAVALAREGLAFAPDSLVLIRYAAVIAGESGDRALGAEVIPRLTNEPEDVALALRFHANERDWAALASIHHTAASGLPESEVVMAETLGAIGALKISGATDLAPGLGTVLEATGDDPRAAVVVADFAMDEGLEEVAETAYDRAVGLIDDDSHVARRQMVSALAMRRGDWSVVADMLSGHIDESRDNDETRRLALAFVNERPIKQRGLRFFRELASDLANRPTYLRLAGLFHFNHGALGQAETALRRAIVVSNDLLSYLALFETLRRRNKADEIAPLIAAVDARTLRGTPGEQMGFAQAWRDVGEGEAAIAFAYDVLQSAPDDPAAALGYLGLVMSDPTEGLIPAAPVVAVDTWVRLEDDLGESRAFLIVAADPRPAAGIVTPDHPLIAVALGLGAKSEFTIEDRLTGPHIWRIAEIKHRYLHALHDVMLNFETRFPNAKGLQRARMREGDIQPALDMIQRAGEADRAIADLYLVKGFPLNMIAAHVTGSVMAFADYIRSLGHDILTTRGLPSERRAAIAAVAAGRPKGALLDTYAAWTAATMGTLDLIADMVGPLAVTSSTMDELRELKSRLKPNGQGQFSVGWTNGQFFKQVLTEAEVRERADLIDGWISQIATRCEILPTVAPDTLDPIVQAVLQTFGSQVLDPAFAAGDDRLLISEDAHFRTNADTLVGTTSTWIQPILEQAVLTGRLTLAEHADFLVKLTWRRHDLVGFSPISLFEVFKADDNDLPALSQACRSIGGPRAEMQSHLVVSAAFLDLIWADRGLDALKVMKATSLLLTALTREPARDWAPVLANLRARLPWAAQTHLDQWVVGHFLPVERLREAQRAPAAAPRSKRKKTR